MVNKNDDVSLASVAVITYNSSEFILETLNSVKNQSYKNIELIISDDCSTDTTVKLCKEWLSKHENHFVKTDLITAKKNTGVSKNCNRGIAYASSKWIKFVAGDDILLSNCIEDNMKYVSEHPEIKVLFSQIYKFSGLYDTSNNYKKYPATIPMNLMNPSFTAEIQYKKLLLSDRITYTPSYFFNKEIILSVGGYDEKLKLLEDYPMWLKFTKANVRLHFMEKVTVAYRGHDNALNNVVNYGLFKSQYLKSEQLRKEYVYPNLPWDIVGKMRFKYLISKIFDYLGFNKKTKLFEALFTVLTIYINPFQFILSFKKRILKRGKTNIFYAD